MGRATIRSLFAGVLALGLVFAATEASAFTRPPPGSKGGRGGRAGAASRPGAPDAAPPADAAAPASPATVALAAPRAELTDPVEAPELPRRESTDAEGYTVVQIPNGVFRYQKEPDEKPEADAGLVVISPRSYAARALAHPEPEEPARVRARDPMRPPAPERSETEEIAETCRKERNLLAQRVLVLRGYTDVDPALADGMLTQLEGSSAWVATAVTGNGYYAGRNPAFPWRILPAADGRLVATPIVAGGQNATMSDALVRWRLEDLVRCETRVRRDRELRR